MHPAAFREEFGFEMAMDFEDASRDRKAGPLYWDGVVSLGRQWMLRGGFAGGCAPDGGGALPDEWPLCHDPASTG